MALYSQTYETPWSYEEEVRAVPSHVAQDARARVAASLEWPHTEAVHAFSDFKLKAEWYQTWVKESRSFVNIDTDLLVGGRIDYAVKYVQGSPFRETAYISVNDAVVVTESLAKGETKSGTIDLTGLIGRTVKITVKFESQIGFWSEVSFDIWLMLGFSEDPPIPPGPAPFDWMEWIRDNAWWMSITVLGLGTIILLMPRPSPPVIVYQPPAQKGE